jgi:hypothetical protein
MVGDSSFVPGGVGSSGESGPLTRRRKNEQLINNFT